MDLRDHFKSLRKTCAACTETNHEKCKFCPTYKILNTPCTICGEIGGITPFAISKKGKPVEINACPTCLTFLT